MKAFEIFSVIFNDESEEEQNILYDAMQGMNETDLQRKYGLTSDEARDAVAANKNIKLVEELAKVAPENKVRFRADMDTCYNGYKAYVASYCAKSLKSRRKNIDYDQIDVQWNATDCKFNVSVVTSQNRRSTSDIKSYTKTYRTIPTVLEFKMAIDERNGMDVKDIANNYRVSVSTVNKFCDEHRHYTLDELKWHLENVKRINAMYGEIHYDRNNAKILNPVIDMSMTANGIISTQQPLNIINALMSEQGNDLIPASVNQQNRQVDIYNNSHKVILSTNVKCGLFADTDCGLSLSTFVFDSNLDKSLEYNFDKQDQIARKFLQEHVLGPNGRAKYGMVLYAPGMSSELISVIKACKDYNIDLVVAYHNESDGTYKYQSVWGIVDACDAPTIPTIVEYAAKDCNALYTYKCRVEDIDQDTIFSVNLTIYESYPGFNGTDKHERAVVNNRIRYVACNFSDYVELFRALEDEYVHCDPNKSYPLIILGSEITAVDVTKNAFNVTIRGRATNM